jgi:NAD(P)-dependent dehydrogenase (short-subunit alcohol dehydrogenase family)
MRFRLRLGFRPYKPTASGIGLTTVKAFAARPDWHVVIYDYNGKAGTEQASALGNKASFQKVDITSYESLGQAFKTTFQTHKRIDFVFANAGIGERNNFYEVHNTGEDPPPQPTEWKRVTDICLVGVFSTTYLAQHYFRLSPSSAKGNRNIVITASCGALYPSNYSPIYTAAKHGVLGFTRSVAPAMYRLDGIRVNAVLPGTVQTNLLSKDEWASFPPEYFTPAEKIAEVVAMLVDGDDKGKTVECSGTKHYYRSQPEYCDEGMRAVMESTDRDTPFDL